MDGFCDRGFSQTYPQRSFWRAPCHNSKNLRDTYFSVKNEKPSGIKSKNVWYKNQDDSSSRGTLRAGNKGITGGIVRVWWTKKSSSCCQQCNLHICHIPSTIHYTLTILSFCFCEHFLQKITAVNLQVQRLFDTMKILIVELLIAR